MSAPDEPGPALIAAGSVIIPGYLTGPLWRLLVAELDRRRRDGGQVRPEVVRLVETLRAGHLDHVTSANGQGGRTFQQVQPCCDHAADDRMGAPALITTEALATRMGCSERHARRLAAEQYIRPVARGLWHEEDARALEVTRQRRR